MRIVLVNRWYPLGRGFGGVAMYNYHLAHSCVTLGHQVTVLSSRLSRSVPAHQNDNGIAIHYLWDPDFYYARRLPLMGRYERPARQLFYSLAVAWRLKILYKKHPFDIVEFADVNAEGFFYALHRDVPIVVRCHMPTFALRKFYAPEEMPYDTQITSWCEKVVIRQADAITAPSHFMATLISNECGIPLERIKVIPNPVDTAAFRPKGFPLTDKSIIIIYVGRLERAKGVKILAEAIPRVLAEIPYARFIYVGQDRSSACGGSQRKELERLLTQAGVISQVYFAGPVPNPELPAWYSKAHIAVVPSLLPESFSYTVAEAMACGLPVVASRIGGIPETMDDGITGILVKPGDVEELAQAIIRLARDQGLRQRMGAAGRAKVKALYNPRRIAKMNLKVYEQALENFQQ